MTWSSTTKCLELISRPRRPRQRPLGAGRGRIPIRLGISILLAAPSHRGPSTGDLTAERGGQYSRCRHHSSSTRSCSLGRCLIRSASIGRTSGILRTALRNALAAFMVVLHPEGPEGRVLVATTTRRGARGDNVRRQHARSGDYRQQTGSRDGRTCKRSHRSLLADQARDWSAAVGPRWRSEPAAPCVCPPLLRRMHQ
jgi:hypothetical protein